MKAYGRIILNLCIGWRCGQLIAPQLHHNYTLIRRLSQGRSGCLGEEIKLWPQPGVELRRYLNKDEFLNLYTFWNDQIEDEMG